MRAICNLFGNHTRLIVASVLTMVSPPGAGAAGLPARTRRSPSEINRQVDSMIAKLTLKQKIELLGVRHAFLHAMPNIALPALKLSDASMGVRMWGPSIAYAAGIGLAASWDVHLAREIGVAQGRDARARGVNILLGPGVNIYRMPMDGRNFEFLGEDPYLAGQLAAEYILGVQSQDVVAMVKHFVANNLEYDRHNENSIIDERTLREIYLPAFEAAVKEGDVGSVMDSYNLVNGEHSTQNKFLNVEVLRKEWGFRGILMSDYDATYNGVAAANAGLDLETPARHMTAKILIPAIKSGKVSVATINEKVRQILYIAVKFGFINHDQTNLHIPLYSRRSLAVALQSARESMVLLKNDDDLLPLDMDHVYSVAVIGPDAYPAVASAGGSAHVTAIDPVSFMTGLSDAYSPGTKVYWNRGVKDMSTIFETSRFSTDREGTHVGLKREEFADDTFSGSPLSEQTVYFLNHWSSDQGSPFSPAKRAYRYRGYYIPKNPGLERFIVAASGRDTYRFYVNGKLVLNQTRHEEQIPHYVDINLPAGKPVSVRFDYSPATDQIRAGLGVLPPSQMLEPNVRKVAAMANVVVLCVGFNPETEGEGHDRTYELPPGQVALIKAVVAANPRTIVVVTSGGSVATRGWLNRVPVVLETWYGGSEAGRALAEVLAGKVDPSGKLPITWWKEVQDNPAYHNYYEAPGTHNVTYREGIFLGYRAYGQPGQLAPLFPFGYGLSYTRFAFSHLTVTPGQVSPNGLIHIRFKIRNVGGRAGAEVAEVYVGDPSATVPMPQKQLKGFERVMLQTGESKEVSVTLNRRSLAYWSVKLNRWHVNRGKFVVYVGDSSEHLPLHTNFTVE